MKSSYEKKKIAQDLKFDKPLGRGYFGEVWWNPQDPPKRFNSGHGMSWYGVALLAMLSDILILDDIL